VLVLDASRCAATRSYKTPRDVDGGQPGNVTTQSYTPYGILASSQVNDGRPRTVTYLSNAQGQVIRRQESDNNAATGDPFELWFRFDGRELGRVGNNGTLETDYATSVSDRGAVPGTGGAFRNGAATGTPVADWGAGYEPVTSYRQGSEGGTYTVREGDTLQGIAERVYGDASLWYKIAQANGLGTNAPLVEGQVLALPRGVLRTANSASTFRPYDPSAVVGDIFPDEVAPQDTSATQPQPQVRRCRNRCGVFGAILLAVVAVAVTAGAAVAALGPVAGGALARRTLSLPDPLQ